MPTLQLFILVAALWLLWSGHYTWLVLSLGLASVLLVVWLCRRMGILDRDIAPFHTTGAAARYLPWLAVEVVKSSLDVMRRVLAPSLPIQPQTVRVVAGQKTDLGKVTYANSITMTPGTLTMDVVDDQLVVHALSDEGAADLRNGGMARKITALEPEGLATDDLPDEPRPGESQSGESRSGESRSGAPESDDA